MIKKTDDCCAQVHGTEHTKELPRLNRISGQIEGVKKMIEKQAYCPEILTQLRAIRSAVNSIEASILEAHLDSCVTEALESGDKQKAAEKILELKEMYRRFNT